MADITLEQVRFWHEIKRDSFEGRGMPRDATDHAKMVAALDAAIKQRDQDAKDAARLEWYFGPSDKKDWLDTYMRGMREGWSVGQWRAAIDAAMVESKSNE